MLVRADASPRIGGGHVMRCRSLAAVLGESGAETTFVSARMPAPMADALLADGFRHVAIEPVKAGEPAEDWDRLCWSAAEQLEDAGRVHAAAPGPFDWIVIDHYSLDHCWEAAMRDAGCRLLVVDDLARRRHDCDLVVNPNHGRSAADYASLAAGEPMILAGAQFALLRPEFAAARAESLRARSSDRPPRVLVSLGSTDVGGLTAGAAEAALAGDPQIAVDVILGSRDAPSLSALRALASRDARLNLHVGVSAAEMVRLMSVATLAVGAAGTTSWERCCLGLPAVTFVLAENQRFIAESLAAAGAARTARPVDGGMLARQIAELVFDRKALASMSRAASGITNGLGCERVAEAMRALLPAPAKETEAK